MIRPPRFRPLMGLAALALTCTPSLWAQETPAPSLVSNVGQELLDTATAPVSGTWQGYAVAAAFGGAMALAWQHDLDWRRASREHRTPWQDKVMPAVSLCGDGWLETGAFAVWYQWGDAQDRTFAAEAIEGQICVAVVSVLCKATFRAARPGDDESQRTWFTNDFQNTSFPSGHAMTAFCSAAILGNAYHLEWLTFPLAAAVAYSRVYHQVHWPTDVVAGAGLGTLIGYTVVAFHERQTKEQEPAIRFSVDPIPDGSRVMLTWCY